jgi:hypothetical protein
VPGSQEVIEARRYHVFLFLFYFLNGQARVICQDFEQRKGRGESCVLLLLHAL